MPRRGRSESWSLNEWHVLGLLFSLAAIGIAGWWWVSRPRFPDRPTLRKDVESDRATREHQAKSKRPPMRW